MPKLHYLAVLILLIFAPFSLAKSDIETETVITQAELDQMLAPIALYPDTVLSHILIAATYPLEVVQAERWARENKDLTGEEALLAAEVEDWDPSVTALVAFPDILDKMSADLDWTRKLGDAFLQDEALVLERIQDLRQYAYKRGNLDSLEHLNVTKEKTTIIIEPAQPEVIYVPYYDTRVIYGDWWWPHHPPVYWAHHPHFHHSHHFYWAPSIRIGSFFYFSSFHWHNRHVVVVPRYRYRDYRFRSGRHVVRHRDSKRWEHNPKHRRGIEYRSARVREHYAAGGGRMRDQRYSSSQNRQRHLTQISDGLRPNTRATRQSNDRSVGRPSVQPNREEQRIRDRVQPSSGDRAANIRRTNDQRMRSSASVTSRTKNNVSSGSRAARGEKNDRAPVIRREQQTRQVTGQRRIDDVRRRQTTSGRREVSASQRSVDSNSVGMRSRHSPPRANSQSRRSSGGARRSGSSRNER